MRRILAVSVAAVVLLLAYPGWIALQVWQQSRHENVARADAIVVLGAAQYNGRPSPVFKARLDQAAFLYHEDLGDKVIVTGGKQTGDRYTESETGQSYLREQDVPEDRIVQEDSGRTTLESLREVHRLAAGEGVDSILVVSDPLHLERIKRIAHDLGFEHVYTSFSSYVRLERSRETKLRELIREIGSILVYEFLDR